VNPLQKAVSEIKFRIPVEILNEAFIAQPFRNVPGPSGQRQLPVSLEHQIRQNVIDARVIVDCNLIGGVELTLDLSNIDPQNIDPYNVIYQIPKSKTQGRVITRVKSVTIGQGSVMGTTNMGMEGASPLLDAVGGVLASALPIPLVSTAYVQMIGENTILVNDNMALPNNIYLRCYVESDSDFSHLQASTYRDFCQLVEYAVKAYIYNTLTIPIGMAQLAGGQELGRFKDIVDTYSDANENYQTFLADKWRTISILNDTDQKRRHLRMLNGGSW
jgi:hypothetical protein